MNKKIIIILLFIGTLLCGCVGDSTTKTYDINGAIDVSQIDNNTGNPVSVQFPLSTNGDTLYAKDIWIEQSNMSNFDGLPTDLVDNLHTVIIDNSTDSIKSILIHFKRTIPSPGLAIGAFSGSFSNVRVYALVSGLEILVVDESTNNTKYTTKIWNLPLIGFNALRLEFHTTDTITLSNLFMAKAVATVSTIQAVNPFGEVISIGATADGSLKVSNEDPHFRPISLRMNRVVQTGITLAIDSIVDSRTITVSPGHGLVANDNIILLQENGEPQFFFTEIISVSGDVLTLDTLVPYIFLSSITEITQYDPDLNKDGSGIVYKAELRNPFSFSIDITRFILHMTDATAMDDGKFGGRTALTYGISLRKNIPGQDNTHFWNAKTNGQIGELSFDKVYDEKAPAGAYGFSSRITYAGNSKHGVAIQLLPGEAVELLIQDDLTLLDSLSIMVEGHFNE